MFIDVLAMSLCVFGKFATMPPEFVPAFFAAMILLPIWGFASFVMFLRHLGEFLQRHDIMEKATGVLHFVRLLLVGVLVWLLLVFTQNPPLIWMGLIPGSSPKTCSTEPSGVRADCKTSLPIGLSINSRFPMLRTQLEDSSATRTRPELGWPSFGEAGCRRHRKLSETLMPKGKPLLWSSIKLKFPMLRTKLEASCDTRELTHAITLRTSWRLDFSGYVRGRISCILVGGANT